MLIVVKLLLVTFAVFSQGRLFPEKEAVVESELDTMALPLDHPEWVLARRAIAAEGLCRGPEGAREPVATIRASETDLQAAPVTDTSIGRILAESCD
jgi:hypothetical protein